jgi:hypothetical protein
MKGLLTYGYRDPRQPTQVAALCQPAPNLTSPVLFRSITRDALGVQRGFFQHPGVFSEVWRPLALNGQLMDCCLLHFSLCSDG